MIIFRVWHNMLAMEPKDHDWHKGDMADELAELQEAVGLINRWSELSDVVYTTTRGRWGGYPMVSPLTRSQFAIGSVYMFPKYTSRWLFFYRAGKKAGASRRVSEVRNPKKLHKLEHIANKYDVDPEQFIAICRRQLRHWPMPK